MGGYLKDNVSLTVDFVKNYLRVEHDKDDDFIRKLINGACEKAERFMNNSFDVGNVPAAVEGWILKKVGKDYEKRTTGLSGESIGGLSSGYSTPEEVAEMENELLPYRVFVGF